MRRPIRQSLFIIIGAALLSPIVGCMLGWGLGAAVWEASRPKWTDLGSPPGGASRIEGIAFPEDSAYSPPTVYVRSPSDALWFYRPRGAEGERWAESSAGCVPCGGWLQQWCQAREYDFLPEYPGRVVDCAEHLPPIPDKEPELFLSRYILLEDGTIWQWERPAQLLGAREIYPVCGLILGTLAGGALVFLILRGAATATRKEV